MFMINLCNPYGYGHFIYNWNTYILIIRPKYFCLCMLQFFSHHCGGIMDSSSLCYFNSSLCVDVFISMYLLYSVVVECFYCQRMKSTAIKTTVDRAIKGILNQFIEICLCTGLFWPHHSISIMFKFDLIILTLLFPLFCWGFGIIILLNYLISTNL